MKPLKTVLFVFAWASAAAFAAGHLEQAGYPTKDQVYKFEVYTGEKDRWDSEKQEAPPLSPGKAARLARRFVSNVPLDEDIQKWELNTISLNRLSSAPEEWVYIVHFAATLKVGIDWNGPVPWIDVPVRMDGTIPKPVVEKKKS